MAFRFAASRSDIIAAAGVCAGHLFAGCIGKLANPVALIVMSGDQDPFAPLEGGIAGLGIRKVITRAQRLNAVDWAKANSITDEATIVREENHMTEIRWGPSDKGVEVRWIIVKNHGHAWPGGHERLPAFLMGPKSEAINATLEFWKFFNAHPKR